MDINSVEGFITNSIKWVIDAQGDSYGDERERLRYYESHSAILTVQTYLMPIVSSIVILIFGKTSIAPVLIVSSIPTVMALYVLIYLARENVSLARNTFRKPGRALWYFAAYLTLPLTIFFKLDKSNDQSTGFWIGVTTGLLIVLTLLIKRAFFPNVSRR